MFARLSDYIEGDLDPEMCEQFEKHFTGCEPCEAFLETLKSTVEQTRKLSSPAADPKLAVELRTKLVADFQRALAAAQR
jgi:anti-sigma factor RsiW